MFNLGLMVQTRKLKLAATLSLAIALLAGCDTAKLAADTTAGLFERAAPAIAEYWDYEMVGAAIPGSIVQVEGIMRVAPDNPKIVMANLQAYIGYGYGWLEDEAELADLQNEADRAEALRARAKIFYLRALDLAKHLLNLHTPGANEAIKGGQKTLEAYLKKNYTKKEDADVLLWAGQAWGLYINMGMSDMAVVADLPLAKAVVQRSIQLDPKHYFSAGKMLIATIAASELGGDMELAKRYYDDAFTATKRRNLMVQVNMARYYAVQTGDYALFKSLLDEVQQAGDVLPEARLNNVLAKRKAARYLKYADVYFAELSK